MMWPQNANLEPVSRMMTIGTFGLLMVQ